MCKNPRQPPVFDIEKLRQVVEWFNAQNEGFAQEFSTAELVKLWEFRTTYPLDMYADRWPLAVVRRVLGIKTSWRELALVSPKNADRPTDSDEAILELAAIAASFRVAPNCTEFPPTLLAFACDRDAGNHMRDRRPYADCDGAEVDPFEVDWGDLEAIAVGEGSLFVVDCPDERRDEVHYQCNACAVEEGRDLAALTKAGQTFREGESGFVERIWCRTCHTEIVVRNGTKWTAADADGVRAE